MSPFNISLYSLQCGWATEILTRGGYPKILDVDAAKLDIKASVAPVAALDFDLNGSKWIIISVTRKTGQLPRGTGNKAYVFWDGVTSQHFQVVLSRLVKTVDEGHIMSPPRYVGSTHALKFSMFATGRNVLSKFAIYNSMCFNSTL